ncbi:hypothetical protein [Acidomonas methanolica]|uniref:Transposase n=1 Tax=Acidomonas methanolica NBRC 104435 TaxID=1231351 RepID=A0A023D8G9_ACIMT|nr:hypothetical protein [Acidomonas methanolica]MBU2653809.1 hypothetical protein [Acidomonas methanolica]TCS31765.1 hypothetical protein EDC31_102318 [Acidomonas methanolica]GAJ30467.1 hypothetical protein Amme_139_004 [Acidomonas methanolica NBRC 104435]GBQ51531.1 hypothetical protein AA0498_1496 [Acidomonas methanolica]GEL00439.1 hypothetical protein AME01nite_29370 [Acidomonas methanolica NBRC 104435]
MTALPPAISLDSLAPAERIALCWIRALMGRVMHGKSVTWKGARRKLREALYIAATSASRRVPVLIAMRDERQGQGTQTILIAVARQLPVILNAMIQKGQPLQIT